MAYSLKELCCLATKYALCPEMSEPSLSQLKERFAGFEWCADKATAAAFGYYAAMEEFNGKKTITKSIHEQCSSVVEQAQAKAIDSLEATDRILTLVYHWLREEMVEEEFGLFDDLFQPFLIDEEFVNEYKQD
jgi:glutamate mutase epsilon subunit